MRALQGAIPRICADHRRPEAIAAAAYVRAVVDRFNLDARNPAVRPTLRELGLTEIDLQRKRKELEEARKKLNRKRLVRQLERDVRKLRLTLLALERHVSTFASPLTLRRLEDSRRRALRHAALEIEGT